MEYCKTAMTRMALCGVPTAAQLTRRWSASGTLWLTDVRLVFVAPAANADGLQAFDFPLAYITHDKFNQPIFACNNLAGQALLLVLLVARKRPSCQIRSAATRRCHEASCRTDVAVLPACGRQSVAGHWGRRARRDAAAT